MRRQRKWQAQTEEAREEGAEERNDEEKTEEQKWAVELRYWKERKHAAQRAGVEADVVLCDQEAERLQAKFKANRPWPARVQAADAAQAKAAGRLAAAQEAVRLTKERLAKQELALVEAQAEADAADREVEALKAEAASAAKAEGATGKEQAPDAGLVEAVVTLRKAAEQAGESLEQLLVRLCTASAAPVQVVPAAMEVEHRKRKEPDDAASQASTKSTRK